MAQDNSKDHKEEIKLDDESQEGKNYPQEANPLVRRESNVSIASSVVEK